MRFTLNDRPFAGRTGAGVTIAIIDSGISASNPHVGSIAGGVNLAGDAGVGDWTDRLGHGTAVAAAIREKAPGADLFAIRVFGPSLATSADLLASAIRTAAGLGCRLVNLSLGTPNVEREEVLEPAVAHAVRAGCIVVSASESAAVSWLPGCLPEAAGVRLDPSLARNELRIDAGAGIAPILYASGLPRPIPGVPLERNVSGISFAVANATGFLARLLESEPAGLAFGELVARLEAGEATGRS